jgi:nicotinamide mononucleotide (NMN) deamidase PncC
MANPLGDTPHKLLLEAKALLHLSTTGAGIALQSEIWANPGCSKYFVGCFTPYSRTQLHSFLGHRSPEPTQTCSRKFK